MVRGVSRFGSCWWGAGYDLTGPRTHRLFRYWGAIPRRIVDRMNGSYWTTKGVLGSGNPMVPISPVEMDRGSLSVVPQVSGARIHRRGLRPTGGIRPVPQRVNNELTDEGGKSKVIPLSVEAEEFSLRTGPKSRVTAGTGSGGSGNNLPSQTGPENIVIRCDAVVPTTTDAGAAALADIAGAVAPVDLAGTDVPAVAGMKFSAVAEVHSSAVDDESFIIYPRDIQEVISISHILLNYIT